MNTRTNCRSCGRNGNTRGNPETYTCRSCRGLRALADVRAENQRKARDRDMDPVALTGGRWVQDGWIRRWEVAG